MVTLFSLSGAPVIQLFDILDWCSIFLIFSPHLLPIPLSFCSGFKRYHYCFNFQNILPDYLYFCYYISNNLTPPHTNNSILCTVFCSLFFCINRNILQMLLKTFTELCLFLSNKYTVSLYGCASIYWGCILKNDKHKLIEEVLGM